MNELIACCGLDCEKCDARIATVTNDDSLREKTAQLWSEMNHAPITKEMINCMGCRVDGVKTPFCSSMCEIRKCVQQKKYATCGDCPELGQCKTVSMITENNPDALSNLKQLKANYVIRKEEPCDYAQVEFLTRESFWNVYRPGCTEHYVLHCYRTNPDFVPELSLVMEVEGKIIGHVMYSWSYISADDGKKIKMMTFGPISIHPDFKRKGYGKILLDYSMQKAKELGAGCLLILGNIDFYGKSGFVTAHSKGIRYEDDPNSDAPYFLCKELDDDFLKGVTGSYKDPEGYFVAERNPTEFEKYESQFPHKEKLVLPGQLA